MFQILKRLVEGLQKEVGGTERQESCLKKRLSPASFPSGRSSVATLPEKTAQKKGRCLGTGAKQWIKADSVPGICTRPAGQPRLLPKVAPDSRRRDGSGAKKTHT